MEKKMLLSALFILMAVFSLSAKDFEEVVYLKNGSIVRGQIIETIPNESLKIETQDGNVFFFRMEEVLKMTKEEPFKRKDHKKFNKPKGYFGLLEGSIPCLIGEIGATVVNGYRVCPQFAVGGGIGFLFFGNLNIPLFLHLRSDFLNRRVSPYFALNLGYNLSLFQSDTFIKYNGFFAAPSLDVSYNVGQYRMTTGLEFSANQAWESDYYDEFGYSQSRIWLGALNIKVGFSF